MILKMNAAAETAPIVRRGKKSVEAKNYPDYQIVSYEEGVACRIGVLWMNRWTDRKPAVEIEVEKLPRTGSIIRAWLFPYDEPKPQGEGDA